MWLMSLQSITGILSEYVDTIVYVDVSVLWTENIAEYLTNGSWLHTFLIF